MGSAQRVKCGTREARCKMVGSKDNTLKRIPNCFLRRRIPVPRPDLDSDKSLLGRGELGDGLGLDGSRQSVSARVARRKQKKTHAFGDGVLGQLSREDKADRGLDLARRDGALLVVRRELGRLTGCKSTGQLPVASPAPGQGRTNALKDVVDERVEDEHRLVRDTRVGVNLLEDLVDVGRAGGRVEVSS